MVHVQSIKFGAWIMISLNLLVAFCAIWMFSRMAPAIQEILSRNARSLYACEQMLGFLAHAASGFSANNLNMHLQMPKQISLNMEKLQRFRKLKIFILRRFPETERQSVKQSPH